jgi:hypothetical protein
LHNFIYCDCKSSLYRWINKTAVYIESLMGCTLL